ncbi:MAG: DUF177 domain-containing protein [Gemmatimonadales bacterium]
MLKVDLGRLDREGTVPVEAQVPADDALWQDSGIEWASPVDVRLRASYAGTGQIVVRGEVSGTLKQECRRCLEPVEGEFDEEVTLVFDADATDEESDEGEAFPFDPSSGSLDLSQAVRGEVILAVNPYVVCDPECKGLCPKCGANLNEEGCDCVVVESDPRWGALRALKDR